MKVSWFQLNHLIYSSRLTSLFIFSPQNKAFFSLYSIVQDEYTLMMRILAMSVYGSYQH